MVILGIDPGTRCGWAVIEDGTVSLSGCWNLAAHRHEGGGMRYLRLLRYLAEIFGIRKPDAVGYEAVHQHLGTDAAHIYGAIVGHVCSYCEAHDVPYRSIGVGTVKKLATGSGNAGKPEVVAAANLIPGLKGRVRDDNEADAIWIGLALWIELSGADHLPWRAKEDGNARTNAVRRRRRDASGGAGEGESPPW